MPPARTGATPRRRVKSRRGKYWVGGVTTVSTYPPKGLFNKDARTIARSLASKRVSPKGISAGIRMLLFYINRAGRQLSRRRREELEKAKRLLQRKAARRPRPGRRAR
ncbi:MAG: DUF3175 domain-containing protein [Candidatus Rokuibacteriota bacterium]